jgi:serine/threonine protein phosphatase PrpC
MAANSSSEFTLPPPLPAAGEGASTSEEIYPTFDVPGMKPAPALPEAVPLEESEVPVEGLEPPPLPLEPPPLPEAAPVEELAPEVPQVCGSCGAARPDNSNYCLDCGWMFPAAPVVSTPPPLVGQKFSDRYQVLNVLEKRDGWIRYRGHDLASENGPIEVAILVGPAVPKPEKPARDEEGIGLGDSSGNFKVSPNSASTVVLKDVKSESAWPNVEWEEQILHRACHPSLPRLIDKQIVRGTAHIVEELPRGMPLWDAWDAPETTMVQRCTWLTEIAEAMYSLHRAGAIFEGIRPDMVVITPEGKAAIHDLRDLLPLPIMPGAPIKATPYTAPEMVVEPERATARAALYGFGAMLYALYLGRELSEVDYDAHGQPRPFIERFPDAHPVLARILMKTFDRDVARRFPTEDALAEDVTGFVELIRTLRHAGTVLSHARVEVAGWTSHGITRTGNEDAFALFQSASGRQDDLLDQTLIILCDGMGGCESGEVASAMAIDTVSQRLLKEPPFAALVSGAAKLANVPSVEAILGQIGAALKEANQAIFNASRVKGSKHRGMGCTCEVVFIDGQRVYVGHIGDSRTYLHAQGQLRQLTRDQTFVNRMVELGQLSEAEALNHPRRNELQQALGGLPQVQPQTLYAHIMPGDAVLVCSDGLPNHVEQETIAELVRSAGSAERCARRLINLANFWGGHDNCTVVVAYLR